MCFRLAILFIAAAALVSAVPTTAAQCNVEDIQCCQYVEEPSSLDPSAVELLTTLGINVSSLTGYVGFVCNPVGVDGSSCDIGHLTCCTNNSHGGLVALDCTPPLS